eukprot:CAMPEP_0176079176 /NCGR_PEP_ID=MMETSP0120_2-20121206/39599_1 /TAXON_ID=160619 /ORGANISM="Kryptoperidinium foliaceum, Strain CCMP 1326" /LENGTH=88 /DNA_ID=CAMNT_0017412931 /DNA_START=18 /DNA_END=280 /DNA_ORIENTATION=+
MAGFNFDELDDLEDSARDPWAVVERRCQRERARAAILWEPRPGPFSQAYGLFYGLRFPCNERTLKWVGPSWLTKAELRGQQRRGQQGA